MNISLEKRLLATLAIASVVWAATATPQRIVLIGDSTVCNYAASKYPWAGWGQELSLYFKSGSVTVINKALGGRSSRSFYTGQWAGTKSVMKAGDILLIQFGHNDRDYTDTTRYTDTTAYKKYLGLYVTEARAMGAHPVFVTPMNMNTWTGTAVREVFTENANNYRAAMIHAATALKVPVLDLEKKSKLLMDTLGQAYMAKFHFMGLDTGEYPNYPNGNADGTHFQEVGSLENARMVTEEIARQPTDSVLSLLAPLLAPLHTITVKTNLASGGNLTKTRRYPAGATATMKVKPATGKVFQYWADAAGKKITDSLRHTFVTDSLDHGFTAMFQGGSTEIVGTLKSMPVRQEGRKLTGIEGLGIQIFDARGRQVAAASANATNLDLSSLPAGVYWACASQSRQEPFAVILGR